MSTVDDLLAAALKNLPLKPDDSAKPTEKKRYSELLSEKVAYAFAEELRGRGLRDTRPAPPGEIDTSGAERRMSGGIGAKKVDVTWATEQSGLLLAVSIKSINFRDRKTGNFQKNLTNRRGDMLFESVTLHRRFPYAVLAGFLFLDKGAETDDHVEEKQKQSRKSTFLNAHDRFRLFTGRSDPAGRDEQYERLYIVLTDANPFTPVTRIFLAGRPRDEVSLEQAFNDLIETVAERNPDFYEAIDGNLLSTGSFGASRRS